MLDVGANVVGQDVGANVVRAGCWGKCGGGEMSEQLWCEQDVTSKCVGWDIGARQDLVI